VPTRHQLLVLLLLITILFVKNSQLYRVGKSLQHVDKVRAFVQKRMQGIVLIALHPALVVVLVKKYEFIYNLYLKIILNYFKILFHLVGGHYFFTAATIFFLVSVVFFEGTGTGASSPSSSSSSTTGGATFTGARASSSSTSLSSS